MIGPLEKGIAAARLATPPVGAYEGVDLSILPKYISFRAALLHNKLTHQYINLILAGLLVVQYGMSRYEIYSLYGKLRAKEYILAPGVQDFTPANPQTVPESYTADAVTDFINQLGNVNPGNIDEQYSLLAKFMSPQLKVRFEAEAIDFKAKIKAESISEMLTVTQREITPSADGFFHVVALARRDRYLNNEYVGHTDEVIEMVLQLIAPKRDRPWYVQINSLSREAAETFRAKKGK
ncbi:hypothetical protein WDW37_07330 [Bdellovibrionota bacterium FG-1]